MRASLIFFILLFSVNCVADTFVPVCERTKEIRERLERWTREDCKDITEGVIWNMVALDLQFSGIKSLKSGDFSGLRSLHTIFLMGNRLKELPEDIFNGLDRLERIRFDDNQITKLPQKLFSGLERLNQVQFERNLLSEIPQNLFQDNIQLRFVSMGSPTLEHIPDNTFQFNNEISAVVVFGAPLTKTSPAAFKGVPIVEALTPTFNVDPEFEWEGQ